MNKINAKYDDQSRYYQKELDKKKQIDNELAEEEKNAQEQKRLYEIKSREKKDKQQLREKLEKEFYSNMSLKKEEEALLNMTRE